MNITEAEWLIMNVLWGEAPLTTKEIVEKLADERKWSRNTVRTLIVRLMEKELIGADKSSSNFKYYPLVEKEYCQMNQTKKLINRIYNGSLGMLVRNFVDQTELTEEDRQELLQIINEGSKGGK
ncbi:MAG: BlaI/MecI/CopY family transcriptional regulator [Clostridiales bacterium]|jgi:BlaI family penicillinase repressor|nr:BlaI/MecI/CopY family transcriptional regulator [Clostridiales bacterium]